MPNKISGKVRTCKVLDTECTDVLRIIARGGIFTRHERLIVSARVAVHVSYLDQGIASDITSSCIDPRRPLTAVITFLRTCEEVELFIALPT